MEIQTEASQTQDTGLSSNESESQNLESTESAVDSSTGNVEESAPPTYQPNFKFKVHDQEHEIPEFLRAAVKDAETEKQLKEIYEKAYGLDHIKPKHQELKTNFESTSKKLKSYETSVQSLQEAYSRGDLDTVFEHLNIPYEKILKYVHDKLNYNELPPEQRQALDSHRDAQKRATELEKQLSAQKEEYEQFAVQARMNEVYSRLAQPDLSQLVADFDSQYGKDAFFKEVWARGRLAYLDTQKDISVDEAVQQVLHFIQGPKASQSQPAPGAALNGGQPAPNQPKKEVPVIPNVSGSASTSPVKQKPRSIQDLKDLHKQMASQRG